MTFEMKVPSGIIAHQQSKVLELTYENGEKYTLSFELLRVESPSAEVKGHSPEGAVLQYGKKDVGLLSIESIGHYGIRPYFTDGHHSGIYSWEYLYTLATQQADIWERYLEQLAAAGYSREASEEVPQKGTCGAGGCGSC